MNATYNAFALRLGPAGLEVTPVYYPANGVEVVEPDVEPEGDDAVE